MRITLDIDDIVLEAAEDLAEYEGKTAGQVLSGLAGRASCAATLIGIGRRGIVTNGMIKRLQQEIDDEELRKAVGHANDPRHRR